MRVRQSYRGFRKCDRMRNSIRLFRPRTLSLSLSLDSLNPELSNVRVRKARGVENIGVKASPLFAGACVTTEKFLSPSPPSREISPDNQFPGVLTSYSLFLVSRPGVPTHKGIDRVNCVTPPTPPPPPSPNIAFSRGWETTKARFSPSRGGGGRLNFKESTVGALRK